MPENVEIVRQMWEALLGDDPASGLSFCDPDIEWDGTNLPDGKVARGHEAVVEHAMRWAEMWEEWRMEPERLIDAGHDQVILVFREIGRSESGLQMNERHAELYTVRDGKVVYRKGFSDPDDAFEAAGLREQAMARENVQIAKRIYEVLADGVNEQALRSLVAAGLADPDAELDLSTAYPGGPVVRMATLSEFFASLPWGDSTRFEPESFRAVGSDRVLVFIRAHGTGVGSGIEVEAQGAHLMTLRAARLVRTESYTDRDKALAAAGLSK